jgi:hypothetical protein
MKIPPDKSEPSDRWIAGWEMMAAQVSMETGVYVTVGRDYEAPKIPVPVANTIPGAINFTATFPFARLIRIYFKVYGHEFETLPELKKALALKAFL